MKMNPSTSLAGSYLQQGHGDYDDDDDVSCILEYQNVLNI